MEKRGRIRGPALGGLHLWMALLLTLLLFPLLVTPQRAQQLRMVVLETSVATQQNKSDPETREPYFLEGHSLQMRCYYKTTTEDYCAEKNTTNLWVHPGNLSIPESHIKVISQTKCNITVEIENASRTDQGSLVCEDRDHPESSTKRVLKIGDAPVPPSNLSLVFEPRHRMTLRLDPIKTAANLNDMDTRWNVMYIWDEVNSPKPCQRKESDTNCQQLTAEGLCQPCVVRLKYSGCGQYRSDGSSGLSIAFNVTVTNMFGTSSARVQFLPADWVKPGSVSSVEVSRGSNSTTLVLKVKSPPLFQGLYQAMGKSGYPLQLAYTVRLLSARDQSLTLPQARKFYDMYGFVRNLPDDQEALQHSGQLSRFPLFSGFVNWTGLRRPCSNTLHNQMVPILALPFSSYHYNVSMVTRGRYIGDTFLVNISQAKTSETSPLEGPGLHASFAYCVHHTSDVCATCILYFKEIPQISRGGVVLNHSLELTLVTPLSVPASNACMGEEGWGGETGGHNNTIVVRGVMMGAVYNVSLQAHTAVGPSPTTTAILNVSSQPLDFAPTNIVMEMSGQSYDMSWTPGDAASEASVTYFAHYCYTVPLQLQDEGGRGDNSSIAASLPLNCVTNMVSRRVDENSRSLFVFDDLNNYPGLTPAFFLSATSSQGGSTNLMPVEAFFARGTIPRAVDPEDIIVQSSNQDPHSLLIKFPLEYGRDLNYKDGLPGRYAIGVVQDDGLCETHCSKMMSGIDPYSRPVEDSVRRPVTYTHKHLRPETDYCVGVNVAARFGRWRPDMWRCVEATTGKVGNESEVGTSVAVGLTVLFLLLAVAGFVWCRKRYRRHEKKFEDAESFLPKPPESKTGSGGKTTEAPSLPPRNGIQGTDNPMFRADSALIPVSVKEESESNSRVSSEVDRADQSTDQGHFEQAAPVTRYGHNPAFTSSDPTLGLHQGDPDTVQDDNNAGDDDDDDDDNSHDNSDEEGDSSGGSSDEEEDNEGDGEDTDCRLLRYHEYGSPSRSSEGSSEPTEETAQVSNTCRYSALATQPPRYSSRGQGHTPIRENSDDDEEGSADDGTDSEEDEAADSGSAPGFGTTRGASIPKTPAPLCRLATEIPQTPAARDRSSVPTDLTTGLDLAAILQTAEASSASPKPQEREPSQDVPAPSGEMTRPAASSPSSSSSSSLSSPTSSSEAGMELSAILQAASLCSTPASRPSGEVTAGASQDREEVSSQGDAALMGGCATADCSDRAEDAPQDDVSASVPPATLQMVQKDAVPAGRFSFSEAVEPCSAENRAVSASAAKRYQRLGRPSVGHNPVTGRAGRTNPPSNSLQLEDILTAAKHCPWKSPDMAVHNGRTPRAGPNRHSACLESGIDSESARDTDMESISPTDASLDTVLLLAQSTTDSEASDLCPLSPISSVASRYAGPRPHKISSQWSRDSGTCSHGHSGEVNGETSPLSPVECLRYNPLCNGDCGDGESFHEPLQYEAQKHISPPMETCTKL